jgi:hypothetical protein
VADRIGDFDRTKMIDDHDLAAFRGGDRDGSAAHAYRRNRGLYGRTGDMTDLTSDETQNSLAERCGQLARPGLIIKQEFVDLDRRIVPDIQCRLVDKGNLDRAVTCRLYEFFIDDWLSYRKIAGSHALSSTGRARICGADASDIFTILPNTFLGIGRDRLGKE